MKTCGRERMIFKHHQFGPWAAVSVLLGVLVDVSSGMMNIQLIPQNPVIGGSVTLSVTGITGTIQSFIWYKGLRTNREYQILTYIPGNNPIIPGPLNNSRMTPFPNGSLQISNLNRTDEGNYIVKMQTNINQSNTHVYLEIYGLTDSDDESSNNGTTTGIGIAVVLLLVLVAVLAYLFAKHRQHKKQPDGTDNASSSPEGPVYENVNAPQSPISETALSGTPVQGTQESHYEQLTHKDKAIYSTLASKAGKH